MKSVVKSQEQGVTRILNIAHVFLKINGIFLDERKGCVPIIASIIGVLLSSYFFVFCVIGIYAYWESIESLRRAEGVPLSIKVVVCLILTIWQRGEWTVLVKKVYKLKLYEKLPEEAREEMNAEIKFYIKFSIIYSAFMIGSTIVFYLKSIFFLQLPLELYTLCDLRSLYCYLSYTLYLIIMDVFMIPFPLGLCLMFTYIVLAIICEIEAIKYALRNVDEDTTMGDVSVIIEQHNQISLIIDEFRNVSKNLFLVTYFASMLSVCIVFYMLNRNGFPPNMDDVTKYLPFIFIFIIEFYIYAFGSNKLTESIESVGDEVYASKWPDIYDLKIRKSLVLMIQKSQTTNGLTIGGLHLLDLKMFINVMQNAFSFYTLMSNLGKE